MSDQHVPYSPLPWRVDENDPDCVVDAQGIQVARCFGGTVRVSEFDRLASQRRQTARFIVAACNALAALPRPETPQEQKGDQ